MVHGSLPAKPIPAARQLRQQPPELSPGGHEGPYLVESAPYTPAILAVLRRAFDGGWDEIAHHFDGDARAEQAARTRLAYAVLVVAREDSNDAERLKREAMEVMALTYRQAE